MSAEKGLRWVIAAILSAVVSFCTVAAAIFYKVDGVRVGSLPRGGPVMLAAGMAGLFGGGLVAVLLLILVLRWGRGGDRSRRD